MVPLWQHVPDSFILPVTISEDILKRHLCSSLWLSDYWNNNPWGTGISPGVSCWERGKVEVWVRQRESLSPGKGFHVLLTTERLNEDNDGSTMGAHLDQDNLVMHIPRLP